MDQKRSITGILLPVMMAGFAAVFWFANRAVPDQDMRMVKPLCIGLFLMSLLQAWRWFAGRDDGAERLTWDSLKRPLLLTLSTLILLIGAGRDFPIAAGLFLAVTLPILGMRRPVVVAGSRSCFRWPCFGPSPRLVFR